MEGTTSVVVDIAGKPMSIETGLLALQADGAVTVRIGDNVLFVTVVAAKTPREGVDFFPLSVDYREKFYAAGKFPGGYIKREARPSEKEILTARVTDRPIRPLFPAGYRNDVQIMAQLLSADGSMHTDILCINGASAALVISEVPFVEPIGAVRVGRVDGEFVVNPTHEQMDESDIELVYAGTSEKPLMIEGSADEISEADMVAAMRFAHSFVKEICAAQLELRRKLGKADKVIEELAADDTLLNKAREIAGADMAEALVIAGKMDRQNRVSEIKESLKAKLLEADPDMEEEAFFQMFDQFEIDIVRQNVIERGQRIDGRAFEELRPLSGMVGVLPRTHGSAIFSRGETQALATVTLGTMSDTQSMDAITGGETEKKFMLHYNFPPYSVGEVRRIMSTSRREIGHGNLAERSIARMIPEDFPYALRVVSEIMGSNGSSSMATICAGTLALMDAGVPIKQPVAGISIGLFTGVDKSVLVTDILGAEDHCGDMDFKVGGTREGITGFQVDLKMRGLDWELVEEAFAKAKTARCSILDFMQTVIPAVRDEYSAHAPRIHAMKIDPEKIGALIGPGGKNIRRITEVTGTQIDIADDGTVSIFAIDKTTLDAAVYEVKKVVADPEVGEIYHGKITGIKEFGAFVEILPGKDGLVHVSQLADYRVNEVADFCKMGDYMWVKCIEIDDRGKIRLSRKEALRDKGMTDEEDRADQ